MYRRNYYQNDPRWITARYRSRCSCGREIQPGDQAMYYPLARTTACQDCGRQTEAELADDDQNQVHPVR
jgi:hypothetical protein